MAFDALGKPVPPPTDTARLITTPPPLVLTEDETAQLIAGASRVADRVLTLSFGARVELPCTPDNEWAVNWITRQRCSHPTDQRTVKQVGRCIRDVTCRSCGLTWTDDSSD